ncbi:M16 family metallopeptidase [Streptomyces abyssomicinicus]|uniref:M16 family metallopeptidase n=1 Tax=Streptomyces abyssomicinicus TaxID=574929 RepID=UPI001250763F|nr:insulinase family protein [Streptomyces abyssomicinicus]
MSGSDVSGGDVSGGDVSGRGVSGGGGGSVRTVPVHLPGRLSAAACVVLHHGTAGDPQGQEDTARAWVTLLRRGSGHAADQNLEAGLERIGTTFAADAGAASTRLVLSSTPEHLADALALLSRTLTSFTPRSEEILPFLHRWNRALAAARAAPGGSAGVLLRRALFPGDRSSQREPREGAPEAGVDADAVLAFHRTVLGASRDLVVAADLTRVDLEALVRRLAPPSPDGPARTSPRSASASGSRSGAVEAARGAVPVRPLTLRPSTGRSAACVIMIGLRGESGGDAAPQLAVARELLAGSASSRLARTLRDAHGLAYAVHCDVQDDGAACALRLRFEVAPSRAPEAVALALDELFRLAEQEVEEEEFAEAWRVCRREDAMSGSPAAVAAARPVPAPGPAAPGQAAPGQAGVTPAAYRRAMGRLVRPDRVAVVVDGALDGADRVAQAVLEAAPGRACADSLTAYARRVTAHAQLDT